LDRQWDDYAEFLDNAEPRLRYALVARFGAERGLEALSETLLYGLRHWGRLRVMHNPVGYLYRAGCRLAWRVRPRLSPTYQAPAGGNPPWVEPGLSAALATLSPRQREVVVLVGAFQFTHAEAAETLRMSRSAVQTHYERGMGRLRAALGVGDE
jgi:DNA-directed RNA polymerase specialized sigma24 family protein